MRVAMGLLMAAGAGLLMGAEPEPVEWERLDALSGTMEETAFREALDGVYAPAGRWEPWMRFADGGVYVKANDSYPEGEYFWRFAEGGEGSGREALQGPSGDGLAGARIALDPGHLGGRWSEMESRHFAIGDGPVVKEGDLVLAAARRLRERLEAAGAEVWLTREDDTPATALRPFDFYGLASERVPDDGELGAVERLHLRQRLAERLFYVKAEIEARAERLNAEARPDLVVALHINAAAWEDPEAYRLVERNDGHVITHGGYLPGELADEGQRFALMWRLARRYHDVERPLAAAMAEAMVAATDLPPYVYTGDNAARLDEAGYVWARNLLANRIFDCPVVYLEPWIANSEAVYDWAGAGDYAGKRTFGGEPRESLPKVYADFVFAGLAAYFGEGAAGR